MPCETGPALVHSLERLHKNPALFVDQALVKLVVEGNVQLLSNVAFLGQGSAEGAISFPNDLKITRALPAEEKFNRPGVHPTLIKVWEIVLSYVQLCLLFSLPMIPWLPP
jgi:hypothetical protein